jgi:S-adenosylmethionine hydrolase
LRPIIALLTDFGTRDHYAGTMKAVVLGICADVTLVDLSHDIPPHDVLTAAWSWLPPTSTFQPVRFSWWWWIPAWDRRAAVSPWTRATIVSSRPDNGVLTAVLAETPPKRVVELTERRYARPTVSKTFEGRDRFAPAAGWLAKGVDLTALGRSAGEYQRLLTIRRQR